MVEPYNSTYQRIARTQSPTNKNYALELPTFGAIVGVSLTEVQWKGLALEEPPPQEASSASVHIRMPVQSQLLSRLSLALKKNGQLWFNCSMSIHTSCRSESSVNWLGRLDKGENEIQTLCPFPRCNNLWYSLVQSIVKTRSSTFGNIIY